jgi:hypothetical protein
MTANCGTEKTKVFDLTRYLNAWDSLPPLQPLAPFEAAEPATGGQVVGVQIEGTDPEPPQV